MRTFLLTAVATLAAALPVASVYGQDADELEQKYAEIESQYRASLNAIDQAARQYNAEARRALQGSDIYMGRYQIYENVISLRNKDALQKWVDEKRQEAGAIDSGRRLGIHNPYDMSSYVRYYDSQGNPIASEARNSYELLEEQRNYWENVRARVRERASAIRADYGKTVGMWDELTEAGKQLPNNADLRNNRIRQGPGGFSFSPSQIRLARRNGKPLPSC